MVSWKGAVLCGRALDPQDRRVAGEHARCKYYKATKQSKIEKIMSAVSRANAMALLNSLAKRHEHYHAQPDATYIITSTCTRRGTADLTSAQRPLAFADAFEHIYPHGLIAGMDTATALSTPKSGRAHLHPRGALSSSEEESHGHTSC